MSRLLKAARSGLRYAEYDLACTIEAHCLMKPDGTPDLSTLDEDVQPLIRGQQAVIAEMRAAIYEAEDSRSISPFDVALALLFGLAGGVITTLVAL